MSLFLLASWNVWQLSRCALTATKRSSQRHSWRKKENKNITREELLESTGGAFIGYYG